MSPLEERAAFFDSDRALGSLPLFCNEVHDRSGLLSNLEKLIPPIGLGDEETRRSFGPRTCSQRLAAASRKAPETR
jgi:hypothetical protein